MNSPNMGFPLSVIGQSTGLQWEQNVNQALTTIDGHNHTNGSGVQIPPSGLNINAPLPFNNQQATGLQAVVFTPQPSLATLFSIYSVGSDLYYNDGIGDVIQITKSGSVNATSSGISSGTASASFSSGTLVVDSNTNTPGNIKAGSYLMGDDTTDGFFVTLSPPTLSSSYSLVLPALPGSTKFVTLDTSGNLGTTSAVSGAQIAAGSLTAAQLSTITDGVTLDQLGAGSTLEVKALGVTGAQIASSTIAGSKLVSGIALPGNPTVSGLGHVATGPTGGTAPYIQWALINASSSVIGGSGILVSSGWSGSPSKIQINYTNPTSANPAIVVTCLGAASYAFVVSLDDATHATIECSSAVAEFISITVIVPGQ